MRKSTISKLATAGLAAFLATATSDSGEIRSRPQNSAEQVWMADGNIHQLVIQADNTGVEPGLYTKAVEWGLENNFIFTDLYRGYTIPAAEQDFFRGMDTLDSIEGPGQVSARMAYGHGPAIGEGRGALAVYDFEVPENMPLGRYHFRFVDPYTNLISESGANQFPRTITAEAVTVVPNLPAMALATKGPGVYDPNTYNPNFDRNVDGAIDLTDWAAAQVESSTERN